MIYLDTSVVVPLFIAEPTSAAVDAWIARCDDTLIAMDWLQTEFASAVSLRLRRGTLAALRADIAHREFAAFCAGGVRLVPASRAMFVRAAALAREASSGLRAGDSLHLAAALETGAREFATSDACLAVNAQRQGLTVLRF